MAAVAGVAKVALDGVEIADNRIDLDPSVEGSHEVIVRLGMRES